MAIARRFLRGVGPAAALTLLFATSAAASPAWLPTTDLSASSGNANNVALGMADSGETAVLWWRGSGLSNVVQASTRALGEPFSAPIDISPGSSTDPDVAVAPDGDAVAVWRSFNNPPGNHVIQASTRLSGGSFSTPVDVAVLDLNVIPQDIDVSVNSAGDAAVVWTQRDPNGPVKDTYFVMASVRPAGGSFTTPIAVSPQPLVAGLNALDPSAVVDPAGNATVVWTYNDGTDFRVQASTRPSGGSFSTPPDDLSAAGEDAGSPAIAVDSSGKRTVAWVRSNGSNSIVQTSSAPAGGAFSSPVDLSASDQDAFTPDIAIAPGGDATAVWTGSNGSNFIIQVATRPPGGAFSTSVDLSTPGQDAFDPDVAMSASGAATVVWRRSDGLSAIAQAATREPGGAFSAPVDLSAPGQDAVSPQVAMDSVGDATAVWYRSNGANRIVQAAGYDADAPVLRSLSIPASGVVGEPVSFSADPFDVWPIASTAFSFGDGTVADGTAVTHTYTAPGSYQVTVAAKDSAGTPVTGGGAISIIAPNRFSLGKLKRNKRTGRATLFGRISAPGRLVLFGGGVRKVRRYFGHSGRVKLQIKPKRKLRKRLKRNQRARSRIKVDFLPTGGYRARKHRLIVLIRKPAGHRASTADRRP